MTATTGPTNRAIVPRWRPLTAALASREVESLQAGRQEALPEELRELEKRRLEWNEQRTLTFAAEFASAALVIRKPAEAREAALFIVDHEPQASAAARAIAQTVLRGRRPDPEVVEETSPSRPMRWSNIRGLKGRIRQDPRNALAWTDLSWEYATLGQGRQAERAMRTALSLAPESRFVVRAATRLLVHRGEPQEAHDLLVRLDRSKADPWLAAAEIAVAGVAEESPRLTRTARAMLESGSFPAHHVTELASALGTLELGGGNSRRARRLFRESLKEANDNSLAQAEWASDRIGIELSLEDLAEPNAYEARARYESDEGDWKASATQAWLWHLDQPFSVDASVFGSYVASVGLGDFDEAIRIARAGLQSNPDDSMLLNNLAYALLEASQVDEAVRVIQRVTDLKESEERATFTATQGLLAFRQGETARGRQFYEAALARAKAAGSRTLEAMIAIKVAEEELRSGTFDPELVARALRLSRGLTNPEVTAWLERLIRVAPPR
jgi:Tfp pilus assembly protein PilF